MATGARHARSNRGTHFSRYSSARRVEHDGPQETNVQSSDIAIYQGQPETPFEALGEIKARKGAQPTPFNKRPSEEQINVKLREQASKLGADAIINVTYKPGVIPSSWRGMTAKGTAVKLG